MIYYILLIFGFFLCFFCFMLRVTMMTHAQYELRLVGSDSLNENWTTVVIHVNDVNDLPPVFNSTLYTKAFAEEFGGPYPYSLLQVYNKIWNEIN